MSPKSRKRKIAKKRQSRARRRKVGDAYEDAVAAVARRLDPNAIVDVGTWIQGPDGRRDLDVLVTMADGRRIVIECKDWDRPIGIALIDALESKRRDLGVAAACICSNSGFTSDALRKAARVGIPPMAALAEGDRRIRVVVREPLYARAARFVGEAFLEIYPLFDQTGISIQDLTIASKPIAPWLSLQAISTLMRSRQSRKAVASYHMRQPFQLQVRGQDVRVEKFEIRTSFEIEWRMQIVELGASSGMYDYLRGSISNGPGEHQVHVKNVNSKTFGERVDISEVPPTVLVMFEGPLPGRQLDRLAFLSLKGPIPWGPPMDIRELTEFVEREEIVDASDASTGAAS
jgi:hypothetical protein